ncbi:MAG: putative oxidoreductase C-terminal domain-containing protein [Bacteroidota bacterium]|nr:putative oxidoreductase C-terminal domain-containing protein [Bacteroidota bacterium]
MNKLLFLISVVMVLIVSCHPSPKEPKDDTNMVKLITLDPGHFHAALVQKTMYEGVDSTVHVYAPAGSDLQLHLDRITAFNKRTENPAHWKEEVYTGDDYFEKMLAEKKGNVVVLAGNNRKKTEYILKSLEAGLNVLADKPMVINSESFEMLKKAFETAKEKNLLLYDIMTERFEITTILQRELSMMPEVFGTLVKGTADDPAIIMESGHCFYKYVSGNVVVRPAWFMDASQQGEGIVDVTTHLVDLVQWECFPELSLDYTKDIDVQAAKRWPTGMTVSQFKTITKLDSVPSYFKNNLQHDTLLKVWSNGEIDYQLRGVHAKVLVRWDYQVPGGNDTHYSMMRGTKANLFVRQGAEQQYKPALYIEPVTNNADYEKILQEQIKKIQAQYPGVELKKKGTGWEVVIPDKYKEGHEAHFSRVTQNFLEYLDKKDIPAWEVPNMLAKYYTTTKALELAKKNNSR